MPATKMVNGGLTASATKHKVGRKSEGKTTEVVSGSRAGLCANANDLSCAPGENGQPPGQEFFRGPSSVCHQQLFQEPNVSVIFFCVSSFFFQNVMIILLVWSGFSYLDATVLTNCSAACY